MRVLLLAFSILLIRTAAAVAQLGRLSGKPLVTHIHTSNAAAHVFRGQLYVYVAHDTALHSARAEDGSSYTACDYHLLRLAHPGNAV